MKGLACYQLRHKDCIYEACTCECHGQPVSVSHLMKAEDTVMSREERREVFNAQTRTGLEFEIALLQAQAKISFKAGIKKVVDCANEAKITTDVFQEDGSVILRKGDIVIPQLYWRAKLKEWGIEE